MLGREPVLGRGRQPAPVQRKQVRSAPVKFIALGGLNEIGKNLYVYECCNDMFIVDCGLAFPDEEMLGVDLVVPDFTYLEK
ncbi:MAG TPA: RNase J family beta-CASP ribonuclease, partial [Ruminococcaceae bacterium]|nr:RNase J family beta-CASP ribonuclease [Oscillospiraceae bacterium]